MKCPACGDDRAYVGFSKIECGVLGCEHYAAPKEQEQTIILHHDQAGPWVEYKRPLPPKPYLDNISATFFASASTGPATDKWWKHCTGDRKSVV